MRNSFSLNEKHSLLEAYDKLPKMSQQDAAAKQVFKHLYCILKVNKIR